VSFVFFPGAVPQAGRDSVGILCISQAPATSLSTNEVTSGLAITANKSPSHSTRPPYTHGSAAPGLRPSSSAQPTKQGHLSPNASTLASPTDPISSHPSQQLHPLQLLHAPTVAPHMATMQLPTISTPHSPLHDAQELLLVVGSSPGQRSSLLPAGAYCMSGIVGSWDEAMGGWCCVYVRMRALP
jgi:hypothetical protein